MRCLYMALARELTPPTATLSGSENCHNRTVAAWRRPLPPATRDSVRWHVALAFCRRVPPQVAGTTSSGKRMLLEQLWREFFSDPSQWWDHRSEKGNARYPDFKHKKTKSALWLDDRLNPHWVAEEMATMAPGTVQLNIFSLNAKLTRYVKAGRYERALELFQQIQEDGIDPNAATFVQAVNACARLRALQEGRRIHLLIIQAGCESDVYVGSCLVYMYSKCGSIEDAWRVFKTMPKRNVVSWNTMIQGYVKCEEGQKGLELFQQMYLEGVDPNHITFVGVLNACASVRALEEGRRAHEQILQRGYESNVFVASSLIDMYAKCGSIEDAWKVFQEMSSRDVTTWNAMIHGYVTCSEGQKALELSQQMLVEGVEPDLVTFVGVLNACAGVGALEEGRRVHEQILQRGFESNVFVASSLIDLYAKCGSIEDAWKLFQETSTRDVIAWNAMIHGFVNCAEGQKALELSQRMLLEGVEPNPATFVGVLNACASAVSLEEGRRVHEQILQKGYGSNCFVANSLIDMYAKCGSIMDAERVFNEMTTRDVVSWNAMLAGYAMHGCAKEALEHFDRMCKEVGEVNEVTFISLLAACSRRGLVEEGLQYFNLMSSVYGISPSREHYACVVDLLGRAGLLKEAEDLIQTMSCKANASVWMSLLGACRIHGNVDIGERVAKQILELDPKNASGYVLLSNIYAAAGKMGEHCIGSTT